MRRLIATALRGIPLLAMLGAFPAAAQNLSPQEVFRRVAPSVVVIEVRDAPENGPSRVIASGSGVVVPDRSKDEVLIATNCHVVDKSPYGSVGIKQGDEAGIGWIEGRDTARDLCMVRGLFPGPMSKDGGISLRKLPAVQVGSSQSLEVGDPVYAVGAPQGLELSLSDGLVSGFREYKASAYIQITAPISKGSSGGGLFDAQGRLVGITTMYVKDGQALNFAVPAQLITSSSDRQEAHATQGIDIESHTLIHASSDETRWLYIANNPEGGVIYLDKKTASKSGPNVTAWIRTTYNLPYKDSSGDTQDERWQLNSFSCLTHQSSILGITKKLRGEVIFSHSREAHEADKTTVLPESLGEAMLDAACSL